MTVWILIFILISPLPSLALDETPSPATKPPVSEMTDEQVAQRARQRSYPGGADEGDLQVQNSLPVPYSKLKAKKIQEGVYKELLESKKPSTQNPKNTKENP